MIVSRAAVQLHPKGIWQNHSVVSGKQRRKMFGENLWCFFSHWSLIEADRSHRCLIAPLKEGKQDNPLCPHHIKAFSPTDKGNAGYQATHSQTGGTSRCRGLLLVGGKRRLAQTSLSLVSVAIFITEPIPWGNIWPEKVPQRWDLRAVRVEPGGRFHFKGRKEPVLDVHLCAWMW